jgi:hypothetical protein
MSIYVFFATIFFVVDSLLQVYRAVRRLPISIESYLVPDWLWVIWFLWTSGFAAWGAWIAIAGDSRQLFAAGAATWWAVDLVAQSYALGRSARIGSWLVPERLKTLWFLGTVSLVICGLWLQEVRV